MKEIPTILLDMEKKKWTGVDLDGCLAAYGPTYMGALWIGDPIPEMVSRINRWIIEGKTIKIFTARVSKSWLDIVKHEATKEDIIDEIYSWCIKVFDRTFEVTAEKDPYMVELWDDIRLMPVERDTGRLITYAG